MLVTDFSPWTMRERMYNYTFQQIEQLFRIQSNVCHELVYID